MNNGMGAVEHPPHWAPVASLVVKTKLVPGHMRTLKQTVVSPWRHAHFLKFVKTELSPRLCAHKKTVIGPLRRVPFVDTDITNRDFQNGVL